MTLPNRSVRVDPAHADVLNAMLGLLRSGQADQVRNALAAIERGQLPVGSFRSAQAALDFLVGRMVAAAHPLAIWLFGSRARGDAHSDSDFDLLAIFADDDPFSLDLRREQLADAVLGTGLGVDVAVCSRTDFTQCADMAGSLIRTVREEGRQVYASRSWRRSQEDPV